MATNKSSKTGKKPSIKQHKLKTSKKLSGVRALARGTCIGATNGCIGLTNTLTV